MEVVVNLISVKRGKNKNHMVFSGYIPTFDSNKEYMFDYVGTEVNVKESLSEEEAGYLANEMKKDFGYPPFEIRDARKILGKGLQYKIPKI